MGKRKTSTPQEDSSNDDESYKAKRNRNNEAVKRSREKSRQKESENSERVNALRMENQDLERQVETLKRELNLLKELFVECAAGGGARNTGASANDAGPSTSTATSSSNMNLDQLDFSQIASSSISFPEQVVRTSTAPKNIQNTQGKNTKKRK